MGLVLHSNFISCRVGFVLSGFTRATLAILYHGKNDKPFCLAELLPCTNTHIADQKFLDLNVCHILPPKIFLEVLS